MSTVDQRVADVVAQAAARVPAFAARLADAGLAVRDVRRVADLAALPVLSKDELLAHQRADPPFGGLLAPGARVRRIFQSPGPLNEPQLAGPDPWRWSAALTALGVTAEDVLLNCFGYHLSPAGAMFDEAAAAVGCPVVPGGVGNQDLQAQAVADLGVTAYSGLPTYLRALIERYDAGDLDPARWRLNKALVTGEPLPAALRELLERRVPIVRMAYGTAEAGLLGYESEPDAGLVVPDGVLVQVCDINTGNPLDTGEGQVVVTLFRPDYPLVRFGTGDISAWVDGPDGNRRLAGVLGRIGAAVKVRGMFLHPNQLDRVMRALDAVSAYRFVVERADHRDQLRCQIVPTAHADAREVAVTVQEKVRSSLRFTADVEIVHTLDDDKTLVDLRTWE